MYVFTKDGRQLRGISNSDLHALAGEGADLSFSGGQGLVVPEQYLPVVDLKWLGGSVCQATVADARADVAWWWKTPGAIRPSTLL